MTFLNGGAWWGLLVLAGLPLFIHWLSRRFPKKFVFSSLEDIKRTLAGRSRVSRWRHLVFLLLRTCALLALILAFLKPVTGLNQKDTGVGQRHVVILLDQSQSMGHSAGGVSTFERARLETSKLLRSLDPLDKINVILVGRAPQPGFGQFSHNVAAALKFIDEAKPVPQEADFQAANTLAAQLAEKAQGPVEYYFVSDFQRKNWANVHFDELPADTRIFFISATEDESRDNQAILDAALTDRDPVTGNAFKIKVSLGNYSRHHFNGKLEAIVRESLGTEAPVALPPWGETDLELEIPPLAPGYHRIQLKLNDDDLPIDNARYLAVNVREAEEVLIITDDTQSGDDPSPPSLYLAAAVNPYGEGKGAYRPRLLAPNELTPSALVATSKLVASRSPEFTDEQAAALAAYMRGGGGLLLFLDGKHDPANLAKLSEYLGEELPLRLNARLSSDNLAGGAMRMAQGDFRSPYLRLFQGERRGNLGFLEFYDLYHAAPTGEGRIVLRYADGTPALAEAQAGLGTLLLCNFSVSELSSNLARQRLFPGWVHDLLANMSAGSGDEAAFLAGDTIYTEAWASEALGRSVRGPGDQEVQSQAEVHGERLHLHFLASDPGVYSLPGHGGRTLAAFAVNTPSRESDLRALDIDVLPTRAPNDDSARLVAGIGSYEELSKGHPAFHWFILAALAFLLIEALLHGALANRRKPVEAS